MVVVVAYWLVSRHWCRYLRNRWILHFRLDPFFLPNWDATKNASLYCDVPTQLLDTALSTKTTAFAGVLWVLEGFMRALKNESDEGRKKKRLSHSRCLVPLGHLPAQNVSNGPSELIFQFEPARFYLKHDPNRSLFSIPFSSINCNVMIIGSHNAVIIRGWLHIGLRKTFFVSTPRSLGYMETRSTML